MQYSLILKNKPNLFTTMNIKEQLINTKTTLPLIEWKESDSDKKKWLEKFKNVFILQQKDKIDTIFNRESFGLHNGFTLDDYCEYEFKEFDLKSKNFGLTIDCSMQCFDIGDNYIYLCLGKKTEKALFESIFQWDNEQKKVIGNGYCFKIEPKTQFIIFQNQNNIISKKLIIKRRINFSPAYENNKIKTILIDSDFNDFSFIKNEFEAHLGGTFYSSIFQLDNEHLHTYWENVTLFHNIKENKDKTFPLLMRGIDHPLFIDNLFPKVTKHTVQSPDFTENLFILYVKLKNGEEHFFKYPKENFWSFENEIEQVSITDTLSFDWIVCRN